MLIAGLLPDLCTLIAKSSMPIEANRNPREHLATLEGFRVCANWVQTNSFESFPIFAASILAAHITAVNSHVITRPAIAFVACRVLYIVV